MIIILVISDNYLQYTLKICTGYTFKLQSMLSTKSKIYIHNIQNILDYCSFFVSSGTNTTVTSRWTLTNLTCDSYRS